MRYARTAELIQAPFSVLCIYWLQYPPSPGVAVAVLGFAAVIMAVRAEHFTTTEKVGWILIASAMLWAELLAIANDRAEHDRYQAEFSSRQIAEFKGLLGQGRGQIDQLTNVLVAAKDTLAFSSGGDSFPFVDVHVITQSNGTRQLGYYLTKSGKYPLYSLTVSVGRRYRIASDNNAIEMHGVSRQFIELADAATYPLLVESIPTEEVAYYSALSSARNGNWEEVIELRRVGMVWVSRRVLFGSDRIGFIPDKQIFDVADKGFPEAIRHTQIYPLNPSTLPYAADGH